VTDWWFAEGSSSPASVTLTYGSAAGAVLATQALVIPAAARATAWANAVTGGQDFSTEVTSAGDAGRAGDVLADGQQPVE
jgi:hypothetical protein